MSTVHFTRTGHRWVYLGRSNFRRRNDYPYGKWTCADGREVLHNRFYEPIWQRRPGNDPEPANAAEWVADIVKDEWFYNDGHGERAKLQRGKAALREWGIPDPYPPRKARSA